MNYYRPFQKSILFYGLQGAKPPAGHRTAIFEMGSNDSIARSILKNCQDVIRGEPGSGQALLKPFAGVMNQFVEGVAVGPHP